MNTGFAETEKEFQSCVIDFAKLNGWLVSHARPARVTVKGRETYRTALQGDAGAPDLLLARGGKVILVELKSEKGKPSHMQTAWITACGNHGRLWRPSDWDDIFEELSGAECGPVAGTHAARG